MKPDRWRQIDELFEAALERDGAQRRAFLEQACGDDLDLRREVEKMLSFDEQAADFIERDVFNVAAELMMSPSAAATPRTAEYKRRSRESQSYLRSDSIDDARFISGDLVTDRYRIFGFLGRGGMGEVYRADDLKLKQPVALKFLPESFSANGPALARFYKEVSVARQISHRHVCRVYDVGEYQGQHFISMEFVRGEELSSLLKRIGHLPQEKAVAIARQLCAGLAAVHERGVLHRDLKPANIMIDEHGDVRITDFGIAAPAAEVSGREAMSGTPAYLSPEQLEGEEQTVRSDIYSLGAVLYELFTGKRAFDAANLSELIRLRKSNTTPTNPSDFIANLDPVIERLILRCLERDPEKRPASALQLSAALPGGDPLATALAAGETPSPEMVAAAPKEGALRPAVAVSLLAGLLVLIGVVFLLSKGVAMYEMVPLNKSPEVLRDRANEIVRKLGYGTPAGDSAYGMGVDNGYLNHVRDTDKSVSRWERLRTGQPAAIYFWYRESPRPFAVSDDGAVEENNPARDVPGMITLTLDTLGRLRSFYAVPPQRDPGLGNAVPPDWSPLFAESGLDQANFQSVSSSWTPPHESTSRAAWEGAYPVQPDFKIRIEAAEYEGKPIYFEIIDSWDRPLEPRPALGSLTGRALIIFLITIFIIVMFGSAFLAWRNLRSGRGDRKGALRLAVFLFAALFLRWLLTSHHVPSVAEAFNFIASVRNAFFWAGILWVVYLAFEPFVRRRWPGRIVSWSRLLAGSFRDPLVGRDILVGAVFGMGLMLCNRYLPDVAPQWFGQPVDMPWFDFPATQLLGIRSFPGGFINQIYASLMLSLILLFLWFLLYILLRRDWLAVLAAGLLIAIGLNLAHKSLAAIPFALVSSFLLVFLLYRYGLLALMSAFFFNHLTVFFPFTSDFTAWYAADFILALIISLALAVFSFYTSLAGQPLVRGAIPDD